jgi:internalin A
MNNRVIFLVRRCFEIKESHLDLGNCGLTDKDLEANGALDILLRRCTHLKSLVLSNEWNDVYTNERLESKNRDGRNRLTLQPVFIRFLFNLENLILGGTLSTPWEIDEFYFTPDFAKLKTINISFNRIRRLHGLSCLIALEKFDVSNNNIIELEGFENSIHLHFLYISNNKIREIKSLKSLKSLKYFFVAKNQVQQIDGLKNLIFLTHVDLSNNQIQEIKGIESLVNLKELDLSNNQIRTIQGLENLVNLSILNLNNNNIQEIKGLQKLISLDALFLSNNQIKKSEGLGKLRQLTFIELKNNKISDVKPLIPFFKKKTSYWTQKDGIVQGSIQVRLNDNPLISPPMEIVNAGNEAVINYFEELERRGTEYLYEAKMLIVGQPRAGKTTLRYKLFDINAELPGEEKTTRGIDIKRLNFDIIDRDRKPRQFHYNVWDFGGQHIYQTTHQFFLTHRSLYVLVIDTGKDSIGNDDTTVNYWLQAVELLGGNSPMLLVRNEKSDRQLNIDLPQKKARFGFLKGDYSVDLNALIAESSKFNERRLDEFRHLKEDIQLQLQHLPLVGFPMPKNWAAIRKQLQGLSETKHYISRQDFIELCKKNDVIEFDRQMELSQIFHDLGIFLHFQDYVALEEFIILQNTWATDAVFAVFDSKKVQVNKGRFSDVDLAEIWQDKQYEPSVHRKLLELMMQFELCYLVDKSNPNIYIIPEMLTDSQMDGTSWNASYDLPLQYQYDFMPRGILTRFIVRMHKNISLYKGQQVVWKTGVRIDGNTLDCPNTIAEITEAWDNKKLDVKVQGLFCKELMTIISFQIDELNQEYFRTLIIEKGAPKSWWYKMIPCNCTACKDNVIKHLYDYCELLERKDFGKPTIECKKKPYAEVNITELLDGVFVKNEDEKGLVKAQTAPKTIRLFLASSSELKAEREQFELFISRENKQLHKKGIFLKLEVWEDFLDQMSQTRLQDEYNEAVKTSDIFVMLYFTKVGKFTAEEFETAFKTFKATNKPKIYTYFKKGDIKSTDIKLEDTISLKAFQDKLKELGHYQTEFENDAQLHLHFKKQLEKLYDL